MKKMMKLPAAYCRVSKRNCAEAKPAFALTSYGVVASPSLSGRSLWRRLIIPVASYRVFWRRRIKLFTVLSCMLCLIVSCDRTFDTEVSQKKVPGITDNEILIGSSLALGGHAGYLGTQTLHGALSYLNHINEQGGIHSRKIKVIAYDDRYDPPRCLANTQKLIIQDKVFALFCYVGTPTTVKIIPLVEEAKIPLVGMFTGANALREPFHRYIINVRASYYQETRAAVKHMVEDLDIKNIAVFYQYDAYGFDGLKGTKLALKKHGLTPVATGRYIRGTMDVEEGLNKIMISGAEAIIMIGTYDPCAKFIKLAREKGFHPIFHNVSFVGADELAGKLGKDGNGIIITQVVPPPEEGVLLPAAKDYARLLTKYYPEDVHNIVGFEGFINAKILVEGLRRVGRDITREGFIESIESIKRYFVGIGAEVSFGPQDHQGLDQVYFTQIRNGKLTLITHWGKKR